LNIDKIDTLFDSLVQADDNDFEDATTGCDLVGQKIGGFEIAEIIGRGGMGVVYLARDTKLKRSVAIKSIPAKLADDSTSRTRFRREAELLASLNHPNIAVIYEIIEQQEGASYLVLEYVPGQTLAQRIVHKPLKLEEALAIGQQVAEAVSAAHKEGVIHRDLKPSNIKITPDGRVKVLDFGLAKPSSSDDIESDITATEPGRVIGTPAYMSPEQARGKATDHCTDIWSFGCIMYQMLTGRLPFEGETATDTLARIIERQPDWEQLPKETPEEIRASLRRCLEKDPDRRLGDIAEAAIEINETLSKPLPTIITKLRRMAMIIGAVASGIILSVIAVRFIPQKEFQPSSKQIRLVVLPFDNLGPGEDEYLANGITDEITTRLVGIHGLRVYKNREESAKRIAKELGFDYILEGKIQRARPSDPNSPVIIWPQLIRASDDMLVWAPRYDDVREEVLQIQSDLAEEVALALGIKLLEPERQALASRPTEDIEAYEYYLRGKEYYNRSFLEGDKKMAVRMYEKAVELDPLFALAHAELSRAHARMYFAYHDRSGKRLALAERAARKALELDPDLPEAHLALGEYYYRGHLNYELALEQYAIVRRIQPNNSELLTNIGLVQRRQGKFEQALASLERAYDLNPFPTQLYHVALTSMLMRNYADAEDCYERIISLAPDDLVNTYWDKAWLYLCWQGSTENARKTLAEALKNIKSEDVPFYIVNSLVTIDVYDRKYPEALDRFSLKPKDADSYSFYFIPSDLRYAMIYDYMDKNQKAKEYYERAIDILKPRIQKHPEDARFHSSIGIAYAGLGHQKEALREGRLGVELLPITKDAWAGVFRLEDLARIYVMVGKHDLAIDLLESLLSKPGEMSIPLLRLDPAWDPLHKHPDFKKLIGSGK